MYKALFTIGLILIAISAYAQDVITLNTGTQIEARVESVSNTSITYIRQDSPSGPVYTIPVSDVFMIQYQNGTKDMFGNRAGSVTYNYPYPEVSKTYAVGDWFDESGISGIVVYVDETGGHGLVMHPQKYVISHSNPADASYSRGNGSFGASSYDDGYLNLISLKNWAVNNNVEFDYFFPEAAYVEQLGAGWYIPACNEAFHIAMALNGGQLAHANKDWRKQFNNTLKSHGGKKLDSMSRVISSTEYSPSEYLCIELENGNFKTVRKVHRLLTVSGFIRPVHKF